MLLLLLMHRMLRMRIIDDDMAGDGNTVDDDENGDVDDEDEDIHDDGCDDDGDKWW